MQYTIVNREIIPAGQAVLRVNDLAIQRGYGIFDYFKTLRHQPVFLEDHLDRFYRSASHMQLEMSPSRDELKELLHQLIGKNNMPDSGVRITLTGGYSADGYTPGVPNLVVTQEALPGNSGPQGMGIQLVSYEHQRQLPAVKTIDYLMAIWLRPFIQERQAHEVLYHQHDFVTECPRANFFIVTADDRIITPDQHILQGIIRKQVIRLAAGRFKVEEKPVSLQDVYRAKEVFITSTTKNILPVVAVDGRRIGDGVPGKLTLLLADDLQRLFEESFSFIRSPAV